MAVLDSGASHTVFSREIADLLRIDDMMAGGHVAASTLGGSFEFYLFDLEVRLPPSSERFTGQVGFAPARIPRNILGRILFFSRFEIGFREVRQHINLRPEE